MSRSFGRVAALFTASVALVSAAPQTQPPSFQAGTRTVAVYATVTNPRGRLVPDLSREDFAVDDNGKRQTLTLFANDIQPITLVMLLDRSGSMKPNFELEEQAAEAFVRAMLPERQGAHRQLRQPHPDRSARVHVGPRRARQDSPHRAAEGRPDAAVERGEHRHRQAAARAGRRVVLVFTDGVDKPMNFSNHNKSLKDVMKRAEEDNIMVYAIGLAGQNGMPDLAGRGGDRGRGAGSGRHRRSRWSRARRLWRRTAADGETRRRAAEDRRGDWRRVLRAHVTPRSGVHVRARRRRAPSSVRARLHPREAGWQDARHCGPSLEPRSDRARPQALHGVEADGRLRSQTATSG